MAHRSFDNHTPTEARKWGVLVVVGVLAAAFGLAAPLPAQGQAPNCTLLSIDLPDQFTARGWLVQQNAGQPGCVGSTSTRDGNINASLNTCTARGLLAYDWPARAMFTEYTPCLPLLTPPGGGADTCSFTFLDNNVYYVYEDQPMADGPITGEPQCCVIENFSMLNPTLPSALKTYNQACGVKPDLIRMRAQAIETLATPGRPAGFYGFFPGSANCPSDRGPGGIDGHAKTAGFGGKTPGAYSQMSFDVFDAEVESIAIPSVCGDNPPACKLNCVNDAGQSLCGEMTLSEFFSCIEQPLNGGCSICHNLETPDPSQFTVCPNQPQGQCPLVETSLFADRDQ